MVFTVIDQDLFGICEPVNLSKHNLQTVRISVESGVVRLIREEENILHALSGRGFTGSYVLWGGPKDSWIQEIELRRGGTYFFAVGPGKIISYSFNKYNQDELVKKNFAVIEANNFVSGKMRTADCSKFVLTIDGSELPQGRGGCRCMILPLRREAV
jgi:arginine deiminase